MRNYLTPELRNKCRISFQD